MKNKICMYASWKDRELTPENIKESFEIQLEQTSREVDKVIVHPEIMDTINDFKTYFRRIRSYNIVTDNNVSKDSINIVVNKEGL